MNQFDAPNTQRVCLASRGTEKRGANHDQASPSPSLSSRGRPRRRARPLSARSPFAPRPIRNPALKSQPDVILHRGGYPGWPWVARAEAAAGLRVSRRRRARLLAHRQGDVDRQRRRRQDLVAGPGDRRRARASTIATPPSCELPDGRWMVLLQHATPRTTSRGRMVTCSRDRRRHLDRAARRSPSSTREPAAPRSLLVLRRHARCRSTRPRATVRSRPARPTAARPGSVVPRARRRTASSATNGSSLEVEKGRIVGIIRNNGARDGYFWKTESRDGGRTWDGR